MMLHLSWENIVFIKFLQNFKVVGNLVQGLKIFVLKKQSYLKFLAKFCFYKVAVNFLY